MDIVNERALYQGFGVQPGNQEKTGELLQLELKVISNEDCYQNFVEEFEEFEYKKEQIRPYVHDGITDQVMCTIITAIKSGNYTREDKCVSFAKCGC